MTGIELKELRQHYGWTQDFLASLLGLKRGGVTVSEWEKGKRNIGENNVRKIKGLAIYQVQQTGEKAVSVNVSISYALTAERLKKAVAVFMLTEKLNPEYGFGTVRREDIIEKIEEFVRQEGIFFLDEYYSEAIIIFEEIAAEVSARCFPDLFI